MKHYFRFVRTYIFFIFASVFYIVPLQMSGQPNGEVKPGAIILLSAKGLVQAIDPDGNVVAGVLKPGAVLAEGYSLKTGFGGEAAMLFSNGTVATLEPRSQVKIRSFLQKSFDAGDQKLSEVQQEPSSSQINLDLDTGSLVVQTKKLDRTSSFTIDSPVGKAVIRGTQFQMGISPAGETKLDVSTSSVAFTPTGGTPVLVSQGKGLDISSTGEVNQRPIDPVISINISTKNSVASNIAGQIPLTTVNQAKEKASALSAIGSASSDSTEESSDDSEDSEDSEAESEDGDARDKAIEQGSMNLRSVSAGELAKQRYDYLNKIDDLLVPPDEIPGSDPGYNPGDPPSDPELPLNLSASKVSYSWDPQTGEITVSFLDDSDVVVSTQQITNTNTYNEILVMLGSWTTDQDTTIDALALLVFIEELTQDPSKYQNFNVAIQSAIEFGRIFLADLTLSNTIPTNSVFNSQNLVSEFTQNPYAYEFGKLLARYGAIGNSGSTTAGSRGAGDAILDLLGQGKLGDANYLSTLLDKTIKPGDSYNGNVLNGGSLGTRSAKVSADEANLLKISTGNVNSVVGGDIKIAANSNLDVSEYLKKKNVAPKGEKIFSIAAAKDLHIEGDVNFANSNHTEDHALALGAADHIEIVPGSSITYEGSNFGMGSYSSLTLEDVDIDVGGNLAIGSLGDLNIKSTSPNSPSTFSVGRYSDTDNIYLYADNIMQIDGLGFNSNTREIYAEAITVNMKDVTFPSTSEVMLRSQDGTLHFNNFNSYVPGAVNLTNVKYGTEVLEQSHFNGSAGHWDSSLSSPAGAAAVKIRAFPK